MDVNKQNNNVKNEQNHDKSIMRRSKERYARYKE